jgi:hypothetical protein
MWGGEKVVMQLAWGEFAGLSSQRTSPGICRPISGPLRQVKRSVCSLHLIPIRSREQAFEAQELANVSSNASISDDLILSLVAQFWINHIRGVNLEARDTYNPEPAKH